VRPRRAAVALLGAAALLGGGALAGCGGDDPASQTVSQEPTTAPGAATGPDATLPTTTTPPAATGTDTGTTPAPAATTGAPTATTGEPASTAPETGGTPAGGEQGQGGAGDEEAARVPVRLTAAGASLSPTTVTIPAFLALEVTVTAPAGAQRVTVDAPGAGTISVPAGGTATSRVAGLKPGDYPVTTAAGGKAVLHVVSGGDPGP
jgi:hypothetical protein